MSAAKCGGPAGIVVEPVTVKKPEIDIRLRLSKRALTIFNKILNKDPNFSPEKESDVWKKAYRMGLADE